MKNIIYWLSRMSFSKKLTRIRKEKGLTQYALSDLTGVNLSQIRRWETGVSKPVLDGLIKLSKALHVSLDELVFEDDERKPAGKMKLLFEAVENLNPKDQDSIPTICGS